MRKRAAVVLLLSALPHLLADEPASSLLSNNDVHSGILVDPIDQLDDENTEHSAIDTTASGEFSRQDKPTQQKEPQSRLQTEQDDEKKSLDHEESQLQGDGEDYEEVETIIITPGNEYSSSPTTSDADNDAVSTVSDSTVRSPETGMDAVDEQHMPQQYEKEEGSADIENGESATEAVHEDGFRLPALSKRIVINVDDSNDLTEDDGDDLTEDDGDDGSNKQETDVGMATSMATERKKDSHDGSSPEKDKESPFDDDGDDDANFVNDNDDEQDKNNEEQNEDENEEDEEDEIEFLDTAQDVIIEQQEATIGTTSTDSPEVDDEVVDMVESGKMAIGTTSTDTSTDVDSTDDDSTDDDIRIDLSILDDDMETNTTSDESADHAKQDTTTDAEADSKSDEIIQVDADESSSADGDSEEIKDSENAEYIQSNATEDKNTEGDGDVFEESTDGKEKLGSEESEVKEVEDEDEDEDLSERVSLDYASKSAGALIIEKTPEFKGTSNLITGDRDRYAIVPCSEEKKYVVLSLSEDILVKEIKLANYERFSSTVKDFQVKGSHDLVKWVDLGTYQAESAKGEQTFVVKDPTWARYLKFKLLTYHGFEHYLTLSQIKVHGSNMVQGFHEQWESIEENNDEQGDDRIADYGTEKSTEATEDEVNDTNKEGVKEKAIVDDGKASNSSASSCNDSDSEGSAETGDPDAFEKVNSNSHNDPSASFTVTSQMGLPLAKFRTPKTFSEILQSEMEEEKLFSDLYDFIPHTMDTLPAHSKNDIGSNSEEGELRTVHQLSQLAIDSIYSIGSRIGDDIALLVMEDEKSSAISSPKMNGYFDESSYLQKKFGSGISSVVNLNPSTHTDNASATTESSRSDASKVRNEDNDSPAETATEAQQQVDVGEATGNPRKGEDATPPAEKESVEDTNDPMNQAIAKLLKDLPSAECLANLDFAEFKSKVSAARKSTNAAGSSPGGRMMEPIFKKLTDEIFALQTSLSVQDQFAKMSVSCYKRVVVDLAMEMEKQRRDQEDRLLRLEEQILEPASMRMFNKLVISLVSTLATWGILMASQVIVTMKDHFVPWILRLALTDDHYQTLARASGLVRDQSSRVIGYLSTSAESQAWAEKLVQRARGRFQNLLSMLGQRAAVQRFLSAWSSFYDGGIALIGVVLVLVVCHKLLRCASIVASYRQPKEKPAPVPTKKKSDPPSSQNLTTGYTPENAEDPTGGCSLETRYDEDVSPEILLAGCGETPSTSECDASAAASKRKKRKKRKPKKRSSGQNDPPPTVVDDLSTKSSEEGVPELDDEKDHGVPGGTRPGNRHYANSPSVVSLDD